eukprot:PLAT1389.1.p2 GENE.PLAT1389.1~~PLAT1389.1.p2  ORF type:complete len:471 (+),score=216.73 PLAT1389.1:1379-2791(+)
MKTTTLLLLLAAAAYVLAGSPSEDRITDLPGMPSGANFTQYAGYFNVNPATGRNLFYWFVESTNDPANDPVVLWLNGGPGCSSLGGMFTENGPFRVNEDGKTLSLAPVTWTSKANMLWLESPSGVGFSYSKDTSDYNVGDVRTANDSYNMLEMFFREYPQFQKNDFWVTGESYGGHYVPQLAARIVKGNLAGGSPKINLKGFMVGNPWTDAPLDNQGAVLDWWTHSIISNTTYQGIKDNCNFSDSGPFAVERDSADLSDFHDEAACKQFSSQANSDMGHISIYDIYADVCVDPVAIGQAKRLVQSLADSGSRFSHLARGMAAGSNFNPCDGDYTSTYLNNADVQKAIHADIPYAWSDCSPRVNYSYTDLLSSVIPTYNYLRDKDITMVVYSGDVDAIVPTPGTKLWLTAVSKTQTKAWRPWYVNKQVGGYVVDYDIFKFVIVRGAGHLVPETQPARGFHMFSSILDGQPL